MITTSFESPEIVKEIHYLKMGVGDENIWRTLYTINTQQLDWSMKYCRSQADWSQVDSSQVMLTQIKLDNLKP